MRAQTLECRHGVRITKSGRAQTINFKLKRTDQFEKNIKWSLALYCKLLAVLIILMHYEVKTKIQGDGRKFLDRFESYFGSQISSQSLNEVNIYWLQPKSATKGEFFIYFCLWLFWVGVTDYKWQKKLTKCCEVSGHINWLRSCSN